jgi:Lrp/AsnC family transcriptional regulator for asnA, asnC and gidA
MSSVVAADTDSLRELMFKEVAKMDGFSRSQTMIILGTDFEADGPPI